MPIDKNSIENDQYKEALLKYAENFNYQKNKKNKQLNVSNKRRLYVIYARKSTEEKDRQEHSIVQQLEACQKFAERNELTIVKIITEEKSAKISGKRPEFDMMLETISKGDEYNSILAWHPDRLARNMKEAGIIMDMIDNGEIADLKFDSFTFTNDASGKLLLSIQFAMAKEFSDKLSVDTKRGIHGKVKEGYYIGKNKRGYFGIEKQGFRKADNWDIYNEAWQDYLNGTTQAEILRKLQRQGETISDNMLSLFFKNPFSAGIYCVGNTIVDLNEIDPKFVPFVSAKEFILAQKLDRVRTSGWNRPELFRPYSQFAVCGYCNKMMTSGVSAGHKDKYLSVTCGNKECQEKRASIGLKPKANTVRGVTIMEFVLDFLKKLLKVDKQTYNKAKNMYVEDKNKHVTEIKKEVTIEKIRLSKIENEIENLSNRLKVELNADVSDKVSETLSKSIKEQNSIEKRVEKLQGRLHEIEFQIVDEFPDYGTFLNLFENIVQTMESTDNAYLIDKMTKLVLLNITVKDKKISQYSVREPFEVYEKLNFLHGVVDRT